MAKIIIDAGHGGQEPGAVYGNRKEKDDTLRLALAVGKLLQEQGIDVAYTRMEDVYQSPFEKAQIANGEGGDFLISFHRNSSPQPNQYSGVETLVYDRSGKKVELAENINRQLEAAGFRDLGIRERPGLIILRRSKMPAVLIEAGFINTDTDNEVFDERFDAIAEAIAEGVLETLNQTKEQEALNMTQMEDEDIYEEQMHRPEERYCSCRPEIFYRVQTGAYRNQNNAERQLSQLLSQNYPAYILREDDLYKVQVGAFRRLENAIRMENVLREKGYSTYITT